MSAEITNIIMVGVGGQGIILASEILSEAALASGHDVRKSEVHGMAQRGGSVSSHIRFGSAVSSPLIERGRADYLLAFEKLESLRACDHLREGGTIVLNDCEITPSSVSQGKAAYPPDIDRILRGMGFRVEMIDAEGIAASIGVPKAANVVLLAALAARLGMGEEILLEVLSRHVPPKYLEANRRAFRLGYGS